MRLYPKDPYLQYVALQLARQQGRFKEVEGEVRQLLTRSTGQDRRQDVNLFGMFSGALAVQESLQLDTMVGDAGVARQRDDVGKGDEAATARVPVPIADLQGPTIQSHPWTEMLGGQTPELSELANCVPADFYFVRFQSVDKLLTVAESGDLWAAHVVSQTAHKAYSHRTQDRIQRQLALEVSPLMRPFYDLAVQEVAIAGSDLFATEGSDVTLLFKLKQSPVFKAQMDAFLVKAESDSDDVKRSTGVYRDIPFVHLTSPDRRVHVFSAYPREDLHVRSNSQVGFQRVLDSIVAGDSAARTLGASQEFAYIRTLMPLGSELEDGFVYLSDPFIRHMVGPQLKLTERRRRLCKNHLHMIGHAAVLYQSQHGKTPDSLAELARSGCAPGIFGQDDLACPCRGSYSLSKDGLSGVCSHHGRPGAMVPCCEIPLKEVTQDEAEAYRQFERQYSQYWRTFFDPIAVRLRVAPDQYRLETIVLPLINNSLYTGLAMLLGGEPAMLETSPVSESTIFSLVAKLDKERLLVQSGWMPPDPQAEQTLLRQRQITVDAGKMRRLAIAMLNYHDTYKHFPLIGSFDDQKKPLLSWRVHLLPFLGHQQLYERFHLDEPWDSEHNRKLIEEMPDVYQSSVQAPAELGTTPFVRVVGADTMCTGTDRPIQIRDIKDGTSNTVMTVEVGNQHAVEWTKPEDLDFSKATFRSALFERFEDSALIGFADGTTRIVPKTVNDDTAWAIITRDGGERVGGVGRSVPTRNRMFPLDLDEFVGPDFEYQLGTFVAKGLGDKVGFHVCDNDPMFDFQLVGFLGQSLGSFSGRRGFGIDDDFLPIVLAIASLNAPVYVSLPLEDAEITDQFLATVDKGAGPVCSPSRAWWFLSIRQGLLHVTADERYGGEKFGCAVRPSQMALLLGSH